MLRTRLLTAALLAPIILVVAWLGEPWLSLLVGLVIFLALVEVIGLLDAAGFEPPQVLMLASGIAVAGATIVAANQGFVGALLSSLLAATTIPGLPVVAFAAASLVLGIASFTRLDPRAGFLTWATSTFGVAYVALLAPFIVLVAHLGPSDGGPGTAVGVIGLRAGSAWMYCLLLLVWGYDTGAYAAGRWLGRRQLIPHISPSKTLEGVAGGIVTATAAAAIGTLLVGVPVWHALLMGPVVGLSAQAGDLAESMLKRAASRKESGYLIPGHGGMLDRLDSFLFAAPVLAGYALLVVGAGT
ncbi:MAG TPA: phosphatidate cytidylyltransferase [Candidatus Limnocylindria bacterium]|jgi:phosphatidate cytidylyltransferase|nr:phosphatidate cytidylyltransferase [Candidatus Limnocylindria bacterium]